MFCKKCGIELDNKVINNEGNIPYCVNCEVLYFPKSNLATIVAITNKEKQVLLLKQNHISEYFVLIAGYYKPGESLEECATREVKEEVGLDINEMSYLSSHYYEKKDALMVAFHGKSNTNCLVLDKTEVDAAKWFSFKEALTKIRSGSIGEKILLEIGETI